MRAMSARPASVSKAAARAAWPAALALLLAACATPLPPAPPLPPPLPVVSDADRYPAPRLREPPAVPMEIPPAGETTPLALGAPAEPAALPPLDLPPLTEPPGTPPPVATAPERETALKPAPRSVREPAPGAALPVPAAPATPKAEVPPPKAQVPKREPPPAERSIAPSAAAAAAEPRIAAPVAIIGEPESSRVVPAGRWAVQVGVFAVARNADTIRARVDQQLGGAELDASERVTEVVQRDGRAHVLVGDLQDRAAAQKLAARLRSVLNQDVVLFQR